MVYANKAMKCKGLLCEVTLSCCFVLLLCNVCVLLGNFWSVMGGLLDLIQWKQEIPFERE